MFLFIHSFNNLHIYSFNDFLTFSFFIHSLRFIFFQLKLPIADGIPTSNEKNVDIPKTILNNFEVIADLFEEHAI